MYHDTDKCDLEAGQRRLNCRLRPNCLPWVLHSMGPMASSGLLLPYCPFPSAPLALAPLSCRHSAACKPHCKPISARRLTIGYQKGAGGGRRRWRARIHTHTPQLPSQAPKRHLLLLFYLVFFLLPVHFFSVSAFVSSVQL